MRLVAAALISQVVIEDIDVETWGPEREYGWPFLDTLDRLKNTFPVWNSVRARPILLPEDACRGWSLGRGVEISPFRPRICSHPTSATGMQPLLGVLATGLAALGRTLRMAGASAV